MPIITKTQSPMFDNLDDLDVTCQDNGVIGGDYEYLTTSGTDINFSFTSIPGGSSYSDELDLIIAAYADPTEAFSTEDEVLYLASLAQKTLNYTGSQLTSIDYADFNGIINHSKTFSYTGSQLTSTQEVFDYSFETWTVDITYNYTGSTLTSTVVSIVKS